MPVRGDASTAAWPDLRDTFLPQVKIGAHVAAD